MLKNQCENKNRNRYIRNKCVTSKWIDKGQPDRET